MGFESGIPAISQLQTYVLYHKASRIGFVCTYTYVHLISINLNHKILKLFYWQDTWEKNVFNDSIVTNDITKSIQ
jgi:hypothetical protein